MLGWILAGLFALGAVAVITVSYIKGILAEKSIRAAVVESVDRCSNEVRLKDLYSSKRIEISADDEIDDEIYEGMIIES